MNHPDRLAPAPANPSSAPTRAQTQRARSNLVILGSAAVLTVYTAGFLKTRTAAERFARADEERLRNASAEVRAAIPGPETTPVVVDSSTTTDTAAAKPAEAIPNEAPAPKPVTTVAVAAKDSEPVPATPKPVDKPKPVEVAPGPVAVMPEKPAATVAAVDSATKDSVSARPTYKDGWYRGLGSSRHGEVEVTITVENGVIVDAKISGCFTRWSCSWISHLPGQVVKRQSAEVDYVSGATQSGNAFYYAAVEAVNRAK